MMAASRIAGATTLLRLAALRDFIGPPIDRSRRQRWAFGAAILHQETELGHLLGRQMLVMSYPIELKAKHKQSLVELRGFELRCS